MPEPATLLTVVRALRHEAEDVMSVELTAVGGVPLPTWDPGDHIDVHLRPGLIRQYSLCGSPLDSSRYTIAVKREVRSRGGSEHVHSTLRPGDQLTVSHPRRKFPLEDTPGRSILVAAGIGITPIASMVRYLTHHSRDFEMHYFARSREHVVFAQEWEHADLNDRVQMHLGLHREEVMDAVEKIACNADLSSHVYVCGPSGFMTSVASCFDTVGLDPAQLHSEKFAAEEVPSARTPGSSTQSSFVVRAERSGVETEVVGAESIYEALARCDVEVPVSCEQGICGTCVTKVLSGTPDHRDDYFTDDEKAENTEMCVCVSRCAVGPLVLDL